MLLSGFWSTNTHSRGLNNKDQIIWIIIFHILGHCRVQPGSYDRSCPAETWVIKHKKGQNSGISFWICSIFNTRQFLWHKSEAGDYDDRQTWSISFIKIFCEPHLWIRVIGIPVVKFTRNGVLVKILNVYCVQRLSLCLRGRHKFVSWNWIRCIALSFFKSSRWTKSMS